MLLNYSQYIVDICYSEKIQMFKNEFFSEEKFMDKSINDRNKKIRYVQKTLRDFIERLIFFDPFTILVQNK